MLKYCVSTVLALALLSCSGGDTQDDKDDTTTDAGASEVVIIPQDANSGGDSVTEDLEDAADDPTTEPDAVSDSTEEVVHDVVEEIGEDTSEEVDLGEHQDDPDVASDPDVEAELDLFDEAEVEIDIADEPDLGPTFGLVSVLVEDFRGPVLGVAVVFSSEEGAVLLSTTTDASGVASFEMDAGGSVTVASSGAGDSRYLRTVFGVQPFDEYYLVLPSFGVVRDPTVGRTYNSIEPPEAITGDATRYLVDNGCTTSRIEAPVTNPISLNVYGSCATDDAKRDVAVWAFKDDTVIGSAVALDQPAGLDSELVVMDEWTIGTPAVVVSLRNSSYALTILDQLNTAWADGLDYLGQGSSILVAPTNLEVAGSVELPLVPGLGDFYENWVTLGYGSGDDLAPGYLRIDQIDHTLNREPVWDLRGLTPPRVYGITVDPSNDRERVEVSWSVDGAPPNVVAEGSLEWADSDRSYYWLFLSAVEGETVIEMPAIPRSLDSWLPSSEAFIESRIQSWVTPTLSYDQLRTFIDLNKLSHFMLYGRSTQGFAKTLLGANDLFIIRSTSVNPI